MEQMMLETTTKETAEYHAELKELRKDLKTIEDKRRKL